MGSFRSLHDLRRRTSSVDNRRSAGRVLVDSVQSEVGEILDLSATGARFETKEHWTVGQKQEMSIELLHMDEKLKLKATCVWIKKSRRKKQFVGVVFEALETKQKKLLTQIAMRSAKGTWGNGPKDPSNNIDWKKLEKQANNGSASSDAA